jgi:hypothetical protein
VLTSVLGIMLLLLGLSWGGREYEWGSPQVGGALLGGVAVLGLFLWLETRATDPVLPLSLFRNSVLLSSTNSLAQSIMQITLALFVPLYAQGVLGTSATASGTIMLPLLIAMLLSNLSAGSSRPRRTLQDVRNRFRAVCAGSSRSVDGRGVAAVVVGRSVVVLGAGTGMIFPTLTLSYQSAVAF